MSMTEAEEKVQHALEERVKILSEENETLRDKVEDILTFKMPGGMLPEYQFMHVLDAIISVMYKESHESARRVMSNALAKLRELEKKDGRSPQENPFYG